MPLFTRATSESIRPLDQALTRHAPAPTQTRPSGTIATMTRSQYPHHVHVHDPPSPQATYNTAATLALNNLNSNRLDGADLQDGIDAGDPLTAKGRTKKRQREKDSFDPSDPDRYRYKAYHIRRAFDLFGHIPTIVNDGIKRRAKEAAGEEGSHIQSDQNYETFNLILNHLDGLSDDMVRLKRNPKEFRLLIRKIREAADQARNNDTANLKKDIACMLTPDGSSVLSVLAKGRKASSKHDRGFENFTMGWYLCPISLDWDNADVRKQIREGKHAILASDWPRLLYANCECNMDDLEQGLGRNMALVRVVKYLFTGRSAAFSESAGGKTTRSGNAALAGMKEITPRVVAYAACMLRYAISNEESWSAMDNEFNLQEFYWHVVSIFDDSDEFGQELLAWWNLKVFGTSIETTTSPASPTSATAALTILKSQRAAKRAANRILRDVSNYQNSPSRRNNIELEDDDCDDIFDSSLNARPREPYTLTPEDVPHTLTDRSLGNNAPQAQDTGDLQLQSHARVTLNQDEVSRRNENANLNVHGVDENSSAMQQVQALQLEASGTPSPRPHHIAPSSSESTLNARPNGPSTSAYTSSLNHGGPQIEPLQGPRYTLHRTQWHPGQLASTSRPFGQYSSSSVSPTFALNGAYTSQSPQQPVWPSTGNSTSRAKLNTLRLDALASVSTNKA